MSGIVKICLYFIVKLILSLIVIWISSLWSGLVICKLLYTGYKKSFGRLLRYKDRSKDSPPFHYSAWDEETRDNPGPNTKTWNHAFVTVRETGIRFHFVYSGKVPNHLAISDIDGETVQLTKDEEGESSSTPKLMLCLHGYPENWFSWRHVLRHFDTQSADDENYFVVAMDLRGYGDSDKPTGKMPYHLNALVGDVKGVVRSLGYDKCTLLGHDWGGIVGWMVTKIYPEILEKYIALNAPHPGAILKAIRRNPKQILKSWYIFFYQMPLLPEFALRLDDYAFFKSAFNGSNMGIKEKKNRLTDAELEVFKYSVRHTISCPINYYRANVWPLCQPGPRLVYPRIKTQSPPEHTVPILLLWGDKDGYLVKEIADYTRSYMNPNNGSKVIFIEGSSHWPQQDKPEKVIKLIVDFLK